MKSIRQTLIAGFAVGFVLTGVAAAHTPSDQSGTTLARAGRVTVTNPNGTITVTGTNADAVQVFVTDETTGVRTAVPVDSLATTNAGSLDIRPNTRSTRGHEVTLVVEVPKSMPVSEVFAGSGDIKVTGVESAMRIRCDSGNVQAVGVGPVQVRAGSGDVLVENSSGAVAIDAGSGSVTASGVKGDLIVRSGSGDVRIDHSGGLVDATVASGEVVLVDATGDVRIAAISGDVHVDRVTGSVEVGNASGSIYMTSVGGDVDVKTASGDAIFTGEISRDHKYRLKSMSGDAVMNICGTPSGFTATMASYSGDMETAFPLSVDGAAGPVSRRMVGRFGDGATQIQIEAFSGSARIAKCRPAGNK
ncbi:MAG TPA: DUF4097 family beta strand repeat-containing protein [Blastocatellia bacterium]|nr:DUF4097 family beta strand repeat-containing protein [Blastocatellia bacterium]